MIAMSEPLGVDGSGPLAERGAFARVAAHPVGSPQQRGGRRGTGPSLRHITARPSGCHPSSWLVAAVAAPSEAMGLGRSTHAHPPLVHYTDVPSRMAVSEQLDRLVAPIEGRFSRAAGSRRLRDVGFEVVAILPGLGWRAIGRRPVIEDIL